MERFQKGQCMYLDKYESGSLLWTVLAHNGRRWQISRPHGGAGQASALSEAKLQVTTTEIRDDNNFTCLLGSNFSNQTESSVLRLPCQPALLCSHDRVDDNNEPPRQFWGLVIEGEHTDVNQKSSGAQHALGWEPKFGFEQLAGDMGCCCFQTN